MYSPKLSYLYTWYPDQTIAPFRCTKNILHGRSQRWDNLGSMYISKQSLRETSLILESRCEWNVELPGGPDNKLKCQKYSLVKQIIILFLNISLRIWTLHIYGYKLLYVRYKNFPWPLFGKCIRRKFCRTIRFLYLKLLVCNFNKKIIFQDKKVCMLQSIN